MSHFNCKFQATHNDPDCGFVAGEWYEWQDINALLASDAAIWFDVFEHYGPVCIEIDGGYICSSGIYPAIRKKHKQVVTFKKLAKAASGTVGDVLGIT